MKRAGSCMRSKGTDSFLKNRTFLYSFLIELMMEFYHIDLGLMYSVLMIYYHY